MDDVTGRDPHRDLSAASRRVLETLTDAADVDGLTALGLETIAARADTSVRTVTRALTALRASGLIVQVRASKAHAPTVYRLTPDGSGHQGDDDYGLSVTEPTTGRSEIAEPARRLLI